MKQIAVIFTILASICGISQAKAQTDTTPYPDYREESFMDMDFEPNLLTPEVPAALKGTVSDYVVRVAESLKRQAVIDIMRDADVFVVNIPSEDLFLPNDTLLSDYAPQQLDKLLPLMKDPYMYKVLIAVHCDDTGSEAYREYLTTERLNSIYYWLLEAMDDGKLSEDLVVIPFAMGSSEPLLPNDTRENRKENRRVEFYFIPGPKMIELARKGTLR